MDTKLDLAFSSKEGTLVISPMKHKHRRPVGSKNKPPKGTGLRKFASGCKCCVLSLCLRLEGFNCS